MEKKGNVRNLAGEYVRPDFWLLMNSKYSAATIQDSVQRLKDHPGGFFRNTRYGNYQPILNEESAWPTSTYAGWQISTALAMRSLREQANTKPVFHTDAAAPPSKLDLLQALLDYCFTRSMPGHGRPGIPIEIRVRQKQPNEADLADHDIEFTWHFDEDHHPIKLEWCMVCPLERK